MPSDQSYPFFLDYIITLNYNIAKRNIFFDSFDSFVFLACLLSFSALSLFADLDYRVNLRSDAFSRDRGARNEEKVVQGSY